MRSPARLVALAIALAASSSAQSVLAQTAQSQASQPSSGSLAQGAAPTPVRMLGAPADTHRDEIVAVVERSAPSVVQVDVTARDDDAGPLPRFVRRPGGEEPIAHAMSSGVVFTADGAILTNNHVVEKALTINVRFRDGRSLPARLVGRDRATDLAVVKVDATDLTPARFADSDAARVGEWVAAVGSPFGTGYTVTAGVLSAKGKGGLGMNALEDYLQTDASINPDNFGGPLCNLQGEVLGINTTIIGRDHGIGFAVPSRTVQWVATKILKTGRVSRAWLGVGVGSVTSEVAKAMKLPPGTGAFVEDVAGDGPASRAHLRIGDVITAVGGHPVHDRQDLVREMIAHEVGQVVELEVVREGEHYIATATFAECPEQAIYMASVALAERL
jgi:S1-C subfamily serine protease